MVAIAPFSALRFDPAKPGRLVEEPEPALYPYVIRPKTAPGWHGPMTGLLARLALSPPGQVLPHEHTRPGKSPWGRRRTPNWREAPGLDRDPLLVLYRDPQRQVEEAVGAATPSELLRYRDAARVEHHFRRLRDPGAVADVANRLARGPVVIADGHHRYEAAVARGEPSVLACLVRQDDPGLRIEATHRIVHADRFTLEDALEAAKRTGDCEQVSWDGGDAHALDPWLGAGSTGFILVGRSAGRMAAFHLRPPTQAPPSTPRQRWAALPVTRLHRDLLPPSLADAGDAHVRHTRDAASAVMAVRQARHAFAVLLPPLTVEQVWEIASHGLRLPQKSTHFVPKPRAGLVMARRQPGSGPPEPWTASPAGASARRIAGVKALHPSLPTPLDG